MGHIYWSRALNLETGIKIKIVVSTVLFWPLKVDVFYEIAQTTEPKPVNISYGWLQ
jgi:hypothetical protein